MPLSGHPEILRYVRQRQLERLIWIETALKYGERLQGPIYCDYFSVSQPTFTHDMNRFVELVDIFGGEAVRVQGWIDVRRWPRLGMCGVLEPIEWQKLHAPESVVEVMTPQVAIESPEVQASVSRAILTKTPLRAEYVSTTTGARTIRFSPHSMVLAIGRNHVRAFDHDKNSFRDFVLARMSGVDQILGEPYVGSDQDEDWNEIVEASFTVREDFPYERRQAIALGFGLKVVDDPITFRCRRCLIDYQLLSMGLRPQSFVDYLSFTLHETFENG